MASAFVDPLLGRTFGGRYRLIERLARGGMSSVYRAQHLLHPERPIAIKTLRRELARDPMQRDRFIREARAVGRVQHENIVEVLDFGESEEGLLYLVMERVDGETLFALTQRERLSLARAFDIVQQCAMALGRAHQMGIVHRDLKPDNVLVVQRSDRPDFVKVLDFGIAKILDAPALTGSQQIFGTPGYIAPEYIESSARIDGRSDLYSLGVILYELVTGALPFDYEFPGDLLVKHLTETPIPPREREPSLPEPVERFVLRCLEKDPAERFRDAHHFLRELDVLRAVLAESGIDAAPRRPVAPRGEGSDPNVPPVSVGEEEGPVGVLGVRRWRARFEALRSSLDALALTCAIPADVDHAMAFAARTLEDLEAQVPEVDRDRAALEHLDAAARDVRATLGRAIDALAAELSAHRVTVEQLERSRDAIEAERATLRGRLVSGDPVADEADALLFRVAAAEQAIASERVRADALEAQLGGLRARLDRENERLECDITLCAHALGSTLAQLEPLAHALRAPLEHVESYVRAVWSERRRAREETA